MKTKLLKFVVTNWMLWAVSAFSQGTFQNLDFESSIPPAQPFGGPSIVGWISDAVINYGGGVSIGGASVSLNYANAASFPALIGNYSVNLVNAPQTAGDGKIAEIAQTGTIPNNARSLRFVATSLTPEVTFAGRSIALELIFVDARWNVFAGDITTLAGQTAELRFRNTLQFDQVTFSPQPVPEPSLMLLLFTGLSASVAAKRFCLLRPGLRIQWP